MSRSLRRGLRAALAPPPRVRAAEGERWIDAPPAAVWAVLRDPLGQARWRPVTVEGDADAWIETPRHGPPIRVRVTDSVEAERLDLALASRGWTGRYAATLAPARGGTRVRATETVEMKGRLAALLGWTLVDLEGEVAAFLDGLTEEARRG